MKHELGGMTGEGTLHSTWKNTPWWHPRYWFGHTMRRWSWDAFTIGGAYDGQWEYATYEQCARRFLEERYGETPNCETEAHARW